MHNATDKTPTPTDDFTHPRPAELTDEQWARIRRDTVAFIDQRVTDVKAAAGREATR